MTLSTRTLLRAALLLVISLCLPKFASALTDQEPPTAVIVSEDFVPPIDEWAPVSGNWSINAGAYSSTAAGPADISTITEYRLLDPAAPLTPTLSFSEFSVHARVRTKGTTEGHLAGVVYQYQDPANYLEAVVSATGVVSLRRLRFGGSFDTLGRFILGAPRDTWVDLEVQWKGGRTTLLVNGQIVLANVADLTGFTSGQVGVVSHGAAGQFDKVRITTPFGDQPFKHDFSSDAPGWTPQSGQWDVQNGTYNDAAVQQTNITLAPIHTGVGPQEVVEYTLHARMLNPYGASGNLVGIVFNDVGSRYTEVVFSPTGVAKMNLVTNGKVQTLATAAYSGRQKVWFDVTLDSSASVWVDGEKIFDAVAGANPDLHPEGGVGLITHWSPGKFDDVWFDYGVFREPCNENFSAPTGSLEPVNGTWTVSGGTLNGTSVIASSIAIPCRVTGNFAGTDAGTDFVLSARLRNQYGASGNLVGLVFNYQDSSSLYAGEYFEVVFSPTGSGALNKYIEGVRYRVADFPHNVPRNAFFDVQLFRSGINTTVVVNGMTVLRDVPQGELRGGRAGVITHWAKANFADVSMQPYVVRNPGVTYTLTHIATPTPPQDPTAGSFQVFGLNDDGVVAGTRVGSNGLAQAFTWRDGTFRNISALLPPNRGAVVFAINNQSDVIGGYQDLQFQDQVFFLSAAGQPIPLPGLPSGSLHLIDVNDHRQILLSARNGAAFQYYVWSNGQLTPLAALPGSERMTAVAINNEGVVTGHSQTPSNVFTLVVWQDGAVMPISVPPNSDNGLARAINDHGAVLARTIFRDVFPGRAQAFIWHEGETTLLARLSPTFNQSDPNDINNAGVVVGVSFNTATTATVWDGTRAQELDSLIDRQDPRQPFVHLDTPYRINNRGQIVARGLDSRQAQGLSSWYLLTPAQGFTSIR